MRKEIGNNIVLFGSRKDIEDAEKVISLLELPETTPSPFAKK